MAKREAIGLSSDHAEYLLDRYRLPRPRLELGRRLHGLAHAAMDVSDGLLGDLGHICEASDKAAEIEADLLPQSAAVRAALQIGLGEGIASVVAGGDDYELLFTAPPSSDAALAALGRELDLPLTRIGQVTEGRGVRLHGAAIAADRLGYRHFT